MCGIFGIVSQKNIRTDELSILAHHAEQRGRDSSGLYIGNDEDYKLYRAP